MAAAQPATAQNGSVAEIFGRDLEHAVGDILHIWTAPVRLRVADAPALLGLTQAVIITGSFDGEIQQWVREHRTAMPLSVLGLVEEPSPGNLLGRSLLLQPFSGMLYVSGHVLQNESLREAGIGCSTTAVTNTLARHVIGRLAGRLRPRYDGGPYDIRLLDGKEWERRSFPNGHGANIMACASFWNHRFDLGPAEPLLYLLASAVGAARITAEAHWASDTVFGLVFGWAIGRGVAARFAKRDEENTPDDPALALIARQPAVSIGWRVPVR